LTFKLHKPEVELARSSALCVHDGALSLAAADSLAAIVIDFTVLINNARIVVDITISAGYGSFTL
jgi:hypothetical protein